MTKTCSTCKTTKALSHFPPNKSNSDGLNTKCRDCYNEYMRVWYSKNQEKHKERVAKYRPIARAKKYGLTPTAVDAMLDVYKGKCWLCKERPATEIDHCHQTNKVRGVLCKKCNTGLGKLGDDVDSLLKAIEYLRG